MAISTAKRSLACQQADITVTLPKPLRSGAKSQGRFGKQDFVYLPEQDVYRCPAGERLKCYFTAVEHGQQLRRYWTNGCRNCAIKEQCTTCTSMLLRDGSMSTWSGGAEQARWKSASHASAPRDGRASLRHIKARMGATHFLMKTLPKVATEMALSVLA